MSLLPNLKWCGEEHPHGPHPWAEKMPLQALVNFYRKCPGSTSVASPELGGGAGTHLDGDHEPSSSDAGLAHPSPENGPQPIDLGAEREQRREGYFGFTCPECGSAWFNAQVCLNKDHRVTGHSTVTCSECGWIQ